MVFDTSSLAYTCLKGCMYMLHKSMLHFPVIIKNTMSDGYGVQLRIKKYVKGGAWLDAAVEAVKLAARVKKAVKVTDAAEAESVIAASSAHPFLTEGAFALLKSRQADREQLNPLQLQQLWEYTMAVMKYKVAPSSVDAEFVEGYIGAYISSSSVRNMNNKFRQLSRFGRAHEDSAAQLQLFYDAEKSAISLSVNSDMSKALGEVHRFWPPAIAACNLLDMLDAEWRRKVDVALQGDGDGDGDSVISFTSKEGAMALLGWVDKMRDDDEYAKLLKVLGIKPRTEQPARTRGKLLESLRSLDGSIGVAADAPGADGGVDAEGDADAPGDYAEAPGDDVEAPRDEAGPSSATTTPPRKKATKAVAERQSTPRGKVLTASKLVKGVLEAAFGISCDLNDGVAVLDITAFTNMRTRRATLFNTSLFIDDVSDEL